MTINPTPFAIVMSDDNATNAGTVKLDRAIPSVVGYTMTGGRGALTVQTQGTSPSGNSYVTVKPPLKGDPFTLPSVGESVEFFSSVDMIPGGKHQK